MDVKPFFLRWFTNRFKEGELESIATVKEYLTVQNEGGREILRKVKYYTRNFARGLLSPEGAIA
jgi:hypothetical protein